MLTGILAQFEQTLLCDSSLPLQKTAFQPSKPAVVITIISRPIFGHISRAGVHVNPTYQCTYALPVHGTFRCVCTHGAWHLLMGLRTSCFSRWVAPKGIQWFSQVPSRHHHHFEADLRTHFTRKRSRKPNISMYLCTPGAWHLLMGRSMAMGWRKSCFSGWVAPNERDWHLFQRVGGTERDCRGKICGGPNLNHLCCQIPLYSTCGEYGESVGCGRLR